MPPLLSIGVPPYDVYPMLIHVVLLSTFGSLKPLGGIGVYAPINGYFAYQQALLMLSLSGPNHNGADPPV